MANVELKTYGDVKAIINKMTKQNIFQNVKGVLADEGVNIAVSLLVSVVPGIGAAKKTYDIFRAIGKKPDTQKTNTWLDKLDIDDQTAAIVDDTVENGFFQQLANTISKIPDDTALDPSFDINKRFEEYLKQKYKNHYVAPVQEIKTMKKSELKKLVIEAIEGGYERDENGKLVRHNNKFDSTKLSDILMKIAKRPTNEGVQDLYSKEEGVSHSTKDLK